MCCKVCGSDLIKIIELDETFSYFECIECRFNECNPLPNEEDLAEYYNKNYSVSLENYESKIIKLRNKDIGSIISKVNFESVLELGCSYGEVLNTFRKYGKEKIVGIEISENARKIVSEKGLLVYKSINELLENSPIKEFDLVISWHVIEHLTIGELCGEILPLVKPNGYIFFVTPNSNSIQKLLFSRFWEWYTPPAHLSLYSLSSIKKILVDHNFEEINIKTREGDINTILLNTIITFKRIINSVRKKKKIESKLVNQNVALNKIRVLNYFLFPFNILLYPLNMIFSKINRGAELVVYARKS